MSNLQFTILTIALLCSTPGMVNEGEKNYTDARMLGVVIPWIALMVLFCMEFYRRVWS